MIKSIKGIDAYTYKLKRRTDDLGKKKSHMHQSEWVRTLRVYRDDMVSLYERSNLFVPNVLLAYCHWYGMVWQGMVRHGKAWHGMAWYDNTAAAATTSGSFSFH